MRASVRNHATIVPRENLDFGLDETIPRHWFGGDPYKTRFLDVLQATFPDGERFFIGSVRAFRERIADPVLQQEVRDFIRQEGQHGMAHTRYNQLLEKQGMPMAQLLARMVAFFEDRVRRHSPEYNLALTAAAEHFTALLAHAFFTRASKTAGIDPRMRTLFAWHAIEEMEHKAVAFDVMQKVAGVGYGRRAAAMAQTTVQMVTQTYLMLDRLLAADGYTRRQRLGMHLRYFGWIHGLRNGAFGSLMPKILAYFRPGFHPTRIPTIHNYRHWLEAYERTGDPAAACEALIAAAYP